MAIALLFRDEQLDKETLQQFAQSTVSELQPHVDAKLFESLASDGTKGAGLVIGQIILEAVSTALAAPVLTVLASVFSRKTSLTVVLKREDGREMTIQAGNIEPDRFEDTLEKLSHFFDEAAA